MKKYIKLILILLSIVAIIAVTTQSVYASVIDTNQYNPGSVSTSDTGRITDITASVLKIIRYIGIVVTAIVITIIGFKYILGSAEEKANYKEGLVPLIIGCILLIATTSIPSLIVSVVGNNGAAEARTYTVTCPNCSRTWETSIMGPYQCPNCGHIF